MSREVGGSRWNALLVNGALLVLALLGAGSLGTQLVAPFMAGDSVLPLAAAMLAMVLASFLLVLRYPHRPAA